MAQDTKLKNKTLVSVVKVDMYDTGLIFARSEKFKVTLKLKAIVLMTCLLVTAAVVCLTISKFINYGSTIKYEQTTYYTVSKKVPYNYDPDALELTKEREILQDMNTKFLPTYNYHSLPRYKRDISQKEAKNSNQTDINSKTKSEVNMTQKDEIIWVQIPEDKKLKNQHQESFRNYKERAVGLHVQRIGEETNNEEYNNNLVPFWNDTRDELTIRQIQASMMSSYMDTTADPCNDFYQYACGNWGHKNPIPKDKAGYDTFEMLRESLDAVLRDLLLEPYENISTSAIRKVKDFFKSCMNEEILEERKTQPLLELIEDLGGWPLIDHNWNESNFDWIEVTAKLRLYNNDILLSQWVGPDIKNSSEYVIQFDQTSLGLPAREYFLQPTNEVYLKAYETYMIKIGSLMGASEDDATRTAEQLIQFETELAQITSSLEERRNVSELYTKMTLLDLQTQVPSIAWRKYLRLILEREVDQNETVVLFAMKYIQELVKLIDRTKPRTISNYLLWRFIRHRVNNLDTSFQGPKQNFYFKLFGREKAPPRWKNCVAQANTNMGMALGSLFVKRYFDENSKNDTIEMTTDIMKSFRDMLKTTEWIDFTTKQIADEKVQAMMLRIGYPDFILDEDALDIRYADVDIHPNLYFENTLNILKHLARLEMNKVGTLVNKSLWNTPPAVVNAYYSRNKNQIMFPAGILQPPFYHKYFPKALNYGGIGVVIGHEITHGFDDKGRLFDQEGNFNVWWKHQAIEGFHLRAQCLIDQYSAYTVQEVNMQIDGVNTQGENIADNGGIKQAFKAYEKWMSENPEANETLAGIAANNEQLFFLNFAQVWCGSMRPEATINKLKTAVHSPGKFRVIGTLSNSEEFARVFKCQPGTPMNPLNKCSVW